MLTIPTIDWVAKARPEPQQARQLLDREVRRADRQRLAVDARRRQRHPHQRPVRHRQRSERRQRAVDGRLPAGLGAAPGRPLGHQRRPAALRYYILDNEPSIWHSTHRDVHPTGATMDEIRDKIGRLRRRRSRPSIPARSSSAPRSGAGAATSTAATTSSTAASTAGARCPIAPTTAAPTTCRGSSTSMRQRTATAGRRLLDVFTVHYYPQGGEFSDDVSTAMQLRRNRSTRSLWDPSYVDETWINDRVQLIPRLQGLGRRTYYPGTQIGITEYNWGAENHINGATTQADILGIFGREGLDMARALDDAGRRRRRPTRRSSCIATTTGNRSTFGDTSVAAATANPDVVSAFAAQRSARRRAHRHGRSTRATASTPTTVNARQRRRTAAPAQVWQLTSANAITRLADVAGHRRAQLRRHAAGAERHAVRGRARYTAEWSAGGADRRPHRAVAGRFPTQRRCTSTGARAPLAIRCAGHARPVIGAAPEPRSHRHCGPRRRPRRRADAQPPLPRRRHAGLGQDDAGDAGPASRRRPR